jgi:predicted outer membrane repeat protein
MIMRRDYFKALILICFMLSLIFLNSNAFGAVLHVPSEYTTIQNAIDASLDGDTILVADGLYAGFMTDRIKGVTIKSENGPENCTIGWVRFMPTISSNGSSSILSGFTIIGGGIPSYGYGIYMAGTSPTIENCIFNDNHAIRCEGGEPQIKDCVFNNNTIGSMSNGGAAIDTWRSSPTISNCNFNGCYAQYGGAIRLISSFTTIPKITNCNFNNNSAAQGGAIYAENCTIDKCIFENNEASLGGAIYVANRVSIISSTFINNSAAIDGGAIYNYASEVIIEKSILTGNHSSRDGGAVYNYSVGHSDIINSVIYGNQGRWGGAIYTFINYSSIHSSTITNNSSQLGGGIFCFGYDSIGTTIDIKNSILWNNTPSQLYTNGCFTISYSDVQGGFEGQGNIDKNPLFEGTTDFHLRKYSPCRDTGTSLSAPTTDIEDNERPIGSGFDMGAYEVQFVVDFSADPTMGPAPLTVNFKDQSAGSITSWEWDFGDGLTSTTQNPSHTYTDPGTYTVALTVTGPGGSDTETKSNYIKVTSPTKAMPWIPLLLSD